MARIRTIKPQHWSDKELPKISLQAHLLWIAMWNFSDDAGVIDADPLLLRSNIFPRRTDIRTEQISQWLNQLVKARFIIPFVFENEGYYLHRTFGTHQKIDRPQASIVPSDIIRRMLDECSTIDHLCTVVYSKGEEGRVPSDSQNFDQVEYKQNNPPPSSAPPPSSTGPPIEDVTRWFRGAGGTDSMAQKFFNKWEASDWMDGNRKITRWTSLANNFIINYQDKELKNGAGRKQTTASSIQAVDAASAELIRDLDAAAREQHPD